MKWSVITDETGVFLDSICCLAFQCLFQLRRVCGVQFSFSARAAEHFTNWSDKRSGPTQTAHLQKHAVLCSLLLLHQKDCTWRQKQSRDTESSLVTLRATVKRNPFGTSIGRDSSSRKSGELAPDSQQRQAEDRCKFTQRHHRFLLNYLIINHFVAIFWQLIASAVVAYTAKKKKKKKKRHLGRASARRGKSLHWTTWEHSVHHHTLQAYCEHLRNEESKQKDIMFK